MIKTKKFSIITKGRNDILNITQEVKNFVNDSGIKNGFVLIFVSGSTAGITLMEFEEGLIKDLKDFFEKIAPEKKQYFHNKFQKDGNGFSHIRSSLLGPSQVIPLTEGVLDLGTWQQIVLIDFDTRPRERNIILKIIGE